MDIKIVPISEIKPYKKNAKKHPEEQVRAIANLQQRKRLQRSNTRVVVMDGTNAEKINN